jgi:DNA-binding transcriptional MerR regulator
MFQKKFYRSGELAGLFDISSDTLRYYERMGLLPRPRRSSNRYREYPVEAAARIRLIRASLSIGFTVKELSRILAIRDNQGAPCRHVRDLAEKKLENIGQQLKQLKRMRNELRLILSEWDERLENAPAGGRAHLLESLADSANSKDRRLITKRRR